MGDFLKKWVLRFWAFVGFVFFVIGISGVPGDIQQWSIWITDMIDDPLVRTLAEAAVNFAEIVNKPVFRLPLIAVGLVAIAWPMKRFFRLRYKIRIWGRSKMSDHVWVSKKDALDEIEHSDWGQMKEPYVSETRSLLAASTLLASLHQNHTISGISPKQKAAKKFQIYVGATLRSFHKSNPKAFRQNEDGDEETEINTLKAFLQEVLDCEILEEFGAIPSIKVT